MVLPEGRRAGYTESILDHLTGKTLTRKVLNSQQAIKIIFTSL